MKNHKIKCIIFIKIINYFYEKMWYIQIKKSRSFCSGAFVSMRRSMNLCKDGMFSCLKNKPQTFVWGGLFMLSCSWLVLDQTDLSYGIRFGINFFDPDVAGGANHFNYGCV